MRTGLPLFDKYLGDVLYAAMVYAILRIFFPPVPSAWAALAIMLAIETFQLTGIPARMLASEYGLVSVAARLLGVQFGAMDLFAYAIGIGGIYGMDRFWAALRNL